MNVAPFFSKWLKDLSSEQFEDGGVPYVIPDVLKEFDHSSAAWGDAAVICPWTIYSWYGDQDILTTQYDSMKKWIHYIHEQGEHPWLWNTGFHFGDWVALDAKEGSYFGAAPTDLVATAYFAYSTKLLAKTASILGKYEDARTYEEWYNNIRDAFNQEFVTPSGRLAADTQTSYLLALYFDLVDDKARERAAEGLVKLIKDNEVHLTTGFVGTPYLCPTLTEIGRTDLAYELIQQRSYPSWLYSVEKGATTIWEHWDGIKEDGTFWSEDMNSFNHYAYGSIGQWMYQVMGGIQPDEEQPGFKHFYLRPQPGGDIK